MGTNRKKRVAPPRYDEAFKAGAVKLVTEQGRPLGASVEELCQTLMISRSGYYVWRKPCARTRRGQALMPDGLFSQTFHDILRHCLPS